LHRSNKYEGHNNNKIEQEIILPKQEAIHPKQEAKKERPSEDQDEKEIQIGTCRNPRNKGGSPRASTIMQNAIKNY